MLLERGEADAAQEVSEELRRSRPTSAATYEYMGELWKEHGEPTRALGRLTRGIRLDEREGLDAAELGMLCWSRWRIRQAQGQDPDDYDQIGLECQQRLSRHTEREHG